MKRKFITGILTGCLLASLSSCAGKSSSPELKDCGVKHETEFGGVYITTTIDDFNKLGFAYGDSVNVTFSNGYTLEDIPYYNGYYVDAGQPLLIAYPGYEYIKAAINYGDDLWERAGLQTHLLGAKQEKLWLTAALDEHSTATVTLNERAKYQDVQEARDIQYSDERTKFPSDAVFANFRNVTTGRLKEDMLYRSASPCDNQHKRAPYVDALIQAAGVKTILNLSDNTAKIEGYITKDDFNSPYFLTLYNSDSVLPIALNMNYLSEEFAYKISQGFTAMSMMDGPYLVHCTEGKDRTGFVMMVLEALTNASYTEIVDDYMVTYDNYYKINEKEDPAKYKTIKEKNIDAMLQYMIGDADADITTANLYQAARKWLIEAGMSEEALNRLTDRLTGMN